MKVLKNARVLILQICGKYIVSKMVLEKLVFYMKKITLLLNNKNSTK